MAPSTFMSTLHHPPLPKIGEPSFWPSTKMLPQHHPPRHDLAPPSPTLHLELNPLIKTDGSNNEPPIYEQLFTENANSSAKVRTFE